MTFLNDFFPCMSPAVDDVEAINPGDMERALNGVVTALASGNTEDATSSLNTLKETSKSLLDMLSLVQGIHPVVALVIAPFKVVYELHVKRRDNDRKVEVVHGKMSSVVAVLITLAQCKPKDIKHTNPHYTEFVARLRTIAADIKSCSAACDAYSNSSFIMKGLRSSDWVTKLQSFCDTFDEHRDALRADISLLTLTGVHGVVEELRQQKQHTAVPELLRQLENPKLREITKLVEAKGGALHILNDDKAFAELRAQINETNGLADAGQLQLSPAAFKAELENAANANIEELLDKQRAGFDAKFDVIKEELRQVKDLITSRKAGSHDKVIDNDLRQVWQNNGRKSTTEAYQFVASMVDFLQQKYNRKTDESAALACMSIGRVRQLCEILNKDYSGWITVRELNTFTTSKPTGFTLLSWLAFWAAGFRIASVEYARRVERTRLLMGQLALQVLPANQLQVDEYMSSTRLFAIDQITRGVLVTSDDDDAALKASASGMSRKFGEFTKSEEGYLKTLLDKLDGQINSLNALDPFLVTKGRRIEHVILPLLDLVLQRHAQVLTTATKEEISREQLVLAAQTINVLIATLEERVAALASTFHSQKLNPYVELKYAFGGMFAVAFGGMKSDREVEQIEYSAAPQLAVVINDPHPENPQGGRREIVHGVLNCASCSRPLQGARFRCLDCAKFSVFRGVDLCDKCVGKSVTRDDIEHRSSHDILRMTRVVYPRDLARVIHNARKSLKTGVDIFNEESEKPPEPAGNAQPRPRGPRCMLCNRDIRLPSWFCVDCGDGNRFVCTKCEETTRDPNAPEADQNGHRWFHSLVKLQSVHGVLVEERLVSLEQKLNMIVDKLERTRS